MPPAVSAVVAGLAVGALCVAANVVAVRDRQPHRVPVVAAGISPARVQAALDRAQPGAFRVRGVADPLAATVEVQEREAHGALVADGSRPTVLVAGADGVRPARTVGRSLTGAARALGLSTPARTRDVVPLQPGDVRGLGLQQVLLGTVLGGFLMGLASAWRTRDEDLDVRLVAYACFALVFGALAALVLDPLAGALRGDFLAIWVWVGVTAFVLATGVAAAARLLGRAGIPVAMALFLLLGSPASAASAPADFLPGLFRVAGPWLPPSAEANALLGTTYFDAGVLRETLVLGAWALAAVGILVVLDTPRGPRRRAAAAGPHEPAAAR